MYNPDLVMVVPSYGRPESAHRLAEAFARTCTGRTELMVVAQADDPHWDHYTDHALPGVAHVRLAPRGQGGTGFVRPANWGAAQALKDNPPCIGFMGDDHLPETAGWDSAFIAALAELGTGYVFGDDGIQGPNFSTHIAMTTDIVRGFGYLANPIVEHLYADNMWTDLGRATDSIRYLPDVSIRHLHYSTRDSLYDETYQIGNSRARWKADKETYQEWRDGRWPVSFPDDAWKLERIVKATR